MSTEAVIVDVIRTPVGRGKPGGILSGVHPVDLLAGVLDALVDRNDLDPGLIDDVIGGCVSQIGEQSYNITRNAVLAAGFPEHVPGTTIDRQCGSSQQAATFAAQAVLAGQADIVIACGVESMSRVPLGSSAAGADPYGSRIRARYPDGLVNQGVSAELIAAKWGFSRDELDEFAARSHRLAAAAGESGAFATEVVPVPGVDSLTDETVRPATSVESLAGLNPAFRTDALAERFPELDWRITPGNSSPLTDGASAALIMSAERASAAGTDPAGAVPVVLGRRQRPAVHAHGRDPGDREGARSRRPHARRHRRVRGQRGVRVGSARVGARDRGGCREAQPARRRDRPRARARIERHAPAHDPRQPARGDRRPLRAADDVRGRRHGATPPIIERI